ncbi:hypothetical protein D3C83_30460 [compost metagenome]
MPISRSDCATCAKRGSSSFCCSSSTLILMGSTCPISTRSYPCPLFALPQTTLLGKTFMKVPISLFTAAVLLS